MFRLFDCIGKKDRARLDDLERMAMDALDRAHEEKDHEYLAQVEQTLQNARQQLNGLWPKPKGA